jgi:cbb3-type cytochrome oxidase cytochrome c subunit
MERVHSRVATILALGLVGLLAREASAADPGLKIFIEKRCYTCHTINARAADVEKEKAAFIKGLGVEPDAEGEGEDTETRGGDLSDVGKKRDAAWLREFTQNPKGHFKDDSACQREAKKKDRKKFKGTPEELDALMAFLQTLKQEAKQAPGFSSCLKE